MHDDTRMYNKVLAGMTITSTTAGTTMAATATIGHIKHGHDKHGRGTPKAGQSLISHSLAKCDVSELHIETWEVLICMATMHEFAPYSRHKADDDLPHRSGPLKLR